MIAYFSRYLKGEALAAAAIEDFCGKRPLRFERLPSGRLYAPYAPFFSCSYSYGLSLCVVSRYDLGADMELCRDAKKYLSVARRFFHPSEKEIVTEENFFEIFTAKEAYAKYTQEGIFAAPMNFSVAEGSVNGVNIIHFREGDYICAVASKNETEVETKWIYL